jgi:hypothetical protein
VYRPSKKKVGEAGIANFKGKQAKPFSGKKPVKEQDRDDLDRTNQDAYAFKEGRNDSAAMARNTAYRPNRKIAQHPPKK